VQPHMNP